MPGQGRQITALYRATDDGCTGEPRALVSFAGNGNGHEMIASLTADCLENKSIESSGHTDHINTTRFEGCTALSGLALKAATACVCCEIHIPVNIMKSIGKIYWGGRENTLI